ncbi:component of SufBCD complex [Rhodobacterales bacterium HKCCE3408]|nr:component of SufBCD complex [Rhodobacterales bacterium HKCCE3408]
MLDQVRQVIDLRSFSNLWYWIVLAALWSSVSHWCLGVPYDLVLRARRGHDQAAHDLQVLAEVNVNRLLSLVQYSGVAATAFTAFLLTGLVVMGWFYDSEFCQALFLLTAPLVLIGIWSLHTARRLRERNFEDVPGALRVHRLGVQIMGIVFIFITAFWGMYVNVTVDPLLRGT